MFKRLWHYLYGQLSWRMCTSYKVDERRYCVDLMRGCSWLQEEVASTWMYMPDVEKVDANIITEKQFQALTPEQVAQVVNLAKQDVLNRYKNKRREKRFKNRNLQIANSQLKRVDNSLPIDDLGD